MSQKDVVRISEYSFKGYDKYLVRKMYVRFKEVGGEIGSLNSNIRLQL